MLDYVDGVLERLVGATKYLETAFHLFAQLVEVARQKLKNHLVRNQ
jgi:hypothetical protein